MAKLFILP